MHLSDDHPHTTADRIRDSAEHLPGPYQSPDDLEIRQHDREIRQTIVRERIDDLAERPCVGR